MNNPSTACAHSMLFAHRPISVREPSAAAITVPRPQRKSVSPFITPDTTDLSQQSSEALMDKVVTGNEKAFAELTRRHHMRCYVVAWRIVRDAALAQDITQEAFMRVWSKSHLWKSGKAHSFLAWFTRITTNLAIDEHRRPSSKERYFSRIISDTSDGDIAHNAVFDIADKNPTPEKYLASAEIGQKIQSALAQLPPRQRQAFVLSQIDGLSNAEAAKELAISVGALELLLVRARRKLREILADLYQAE